MKRLSLALLVLVVFCGLILLLNYLQLKQTLPTSIECFAKIYRSPANVAQETISSFQYDEEAAELILHNYLTQTPCPNTSTISRENDMALKFMSLDDGKSYAMSAYFIAPSVHYQSRVNVVRIFGHDEKRLFRKVYCHIWFHGMSHQIIVEGIFDKGINSEKAGDSVRRFIIMCPLPISHRIPKTVSISEQQCPRTHAFIPVFRPTQMENQPLDIGACVIDTNEEETHVERMVEWMEAHLHFGVSHITSFETVDAANLRLTTLDLYEKENSVKVIKYEMNEGINEDDLKRALIADCLFRNVYRYRHLVVITFNDFLVPDNLTTGSLQMLFKHHNSFSSIAFKGIPQSKVVDDFLPSASSVRVLNVPSLFLTEPGPKKSALDGVQVYTFPDCNAGIDEKCTSVLDSVAGKPSAKDLNNLVVQLEQRVEDRLQMAKQINLVLNGDD